MVWRSSLLALVASCASVDLPLPVDGQIYSCTVTYPDRLHQLDRCGPWDDWRLVAESVMESHPGSVGVNCRGTRVACSYDPESFE